jgi:transcription antitermination factor NusG
MNEKWYAVYTKPRWEKKVAKALSENGVITYCPINKVIRQWSDRKKTVYEPLFTSYVFVHINEKQVSDVKKQTGVLNFIYWLGKPAIIKDDEIEIIKKFLNEHQNVKLEKNDFSLNEKIRVTTGTFMDKEGTIVAIKNHTIKVALPSLNYVMYAEVDKSNAEKVKGSKL